MEFFYRDMRRKTGLLMQGDEPTGGRWNFDAENRKPAKPDLLRPRHPRFPPDEITVEVIATVEKLFPDNFGKLDGFGFAVTRPDAEELLESFIVDFLSGFGETQDAMLQNDSFLNHSLLSFYINAGLLDALAVCRAAERAYLDGSAPINAVEGFIRQIIGWREYMRGIYWYAGPDYVDSNFFENARPLPSFYWSGKTNMNCLSTVINETIQNAYLPPYCPDFNPIENAFSKLKALLRAKAERTIKALWDALATALKQFSPLECANYFKAAGYEPD